MSELEELRIAMYENAKLCNKRTKKWHDKRIIKRELMEVKLVLLFNSRLKLFPGKLRSKWSGPFKIKRVMSVGFVEV